MTIDRQGIRMKGVLRKTTLYVIALSCCRSVFCRDFSSGKRLTLRLGVNCDVTGAAILKFGISAYVLFRYLSSTDVLMLRAPLCQQPSVGLAVLYYT